MNSVHDMGGMHGFGAVVPEHDEPTFHATWEGRVLGMSRSLGYAGAWNVHMSRAARESLNPVDYLSASYYGNMLLTMQKQLVARGFVGQDELDAGRSLRPGKPLPRQVSPDDVSPILRRRKKALAAPGAPRFKVGDRVRARNINPPTHTRLPRYARGRVGVVEAVAGVNALADAAALGAEQPEWYYTVVFAGPEIWGEGSDPRLSIVIGAAESYLEPVA
jgi:nitrile hydratase